MTALDGRKSWTLSSICSCVGDIPIQSRVASNAALNSSLVAMGSWTVQSFIDDLHSRQLAFRLPVYATFVQRRRNAFHSTAACRGSRDGTPLQQLPTPARYTPFSDDRDHRLMAFRMLVRDFTAGIEQGISPAPNFTDGLRCQEVQDAVRESSESGCRVNL